jgi:hypothetical protein
MLSNDVYLGIARSGDYVKVDAHEALVDEALFQRVQARIARRRTSTSGRKPSTDAYLAKILRCAHCGGMMSPDTQRTERTYRCKNLLCEHTGQGVYQRDVLDLITEKATEWHSMVSPQYMLIQGTKEAKLPALKEAWRKQQDELEELQRERHGSLSKLSLPAYGRLLAEGEEAVNDAAERVEQAWAARGWLSTETEDVRQQISADPVKLNSFLRELLNVYVSSFGRSYRGPVEARLRFQFLTGEENSAGGVPATDEEIAEFILGNPEQASADALARAKAVRAAAS